MYPLACLHLPDSFPKAMLREAMHTGQGKGGATGSRHRETVASRRQSLPTVSLCLRQDLSRNLSKGGIICHGSEFCCFQ